MIDFNVCLTGFALGLFVATVSSLLNIIISALFKVMMG